MIERERKSVGWLVKYVGPIKISIIPVPFVPLFLVKFSYTFYEKSYM